MFLLCELRRILSTNPTGFLWTLALLPAFMLTGVATRLLHAIPFAIQLPLLVLYLYLMGIKVTALTPGFIVRSLHEFFQTAFTVLFVFATARPTHRRSYINRCIERYRHPDHYGYRPTWFEARVLNALVGVHDWCMRRTIATYWLFCRLADHFLYLPHLYMWVSRGGNWRSHRTYWLRPHYMDDTAVPHRPYLFELWWVGVFWSTHPLLPEFGFGGSDYEQFARYWVRHSSKKHEKLIVHLFLFVANAAQCEKWAQVLTLVPLALNGVLDKGIVQVLINFVGNNLDAPFPQEGAWTDFKSAVKCWGEARDSPFIRRFEKLIYASIATGLLSSAGVTVSESLLSRAVEGSKDLVKKDIADCVLYTAESVIHFVDAISHYLSKDGSYRSFFMRSFDATELDNAYTFLISNKDLFFAGCLDKAGSNEQEYLTKLEFVRATFKTMGERGSLGHIERTVLGQRALRIEELKASVLLRSTQLTMRVAPFVVKLFSSTAQGKSVFVDEVQAHILRVNGLPTNREYCATVNEDDKFDSTVKSNTVVIRMDDFPKIRPEYAKTNPVDSIMRIANNELTAAVKAELDQKGTVFFNNRLLMITTNKADLYSPIYSVEPAALMRRIDVHATFVAREEFTNHLGHLDPARIREHPDTIAGKFVDAHLISIDEWRKSADAWSLLPKRYSWPQMYQDRFGYPAVEVLQNLTTNKFLHYLTATSHAHFAHQATLLARADGVFEDTECPECLVSTSRCSCPPVLQPQAGGHIVRTALLHGYNHVLGVRMYLYPGTWTAWFAARQLATRLFFAAYGERFARYLLTTVARTAVTVTLLDAFIVHQRRLRCLMWLSATGAIACAGHAVLAAQPRYLWATAAFAGLAVVLRLIALYARGVYASYRGFYWARAAGASRLTRYFVYFLSGAVALQTMYRYFKPMQPTAQGATVSAPADYRPWAAYANARPVPPALLTTTPSQTKDVIGKQVAHITVLTSEGKTRTGNGLIVCTNFLLTNRHILDLPEGVTANMSLTIGPDRWGANMKHIEITPHTMEEVRNPSGCPTDLVLVHLQGGGARRDLTAFMSKDHLPFPTRFQDPRRMRAYELYRGSDAELRISTHSVVSCSTNSELGEGVAALMQKRTTPTFQGLCGSVTLTDEGGKTVIAGIHFLGRENSNEGFSTQVAGPWVQDAISRLLARSKFLAKGVESALVPECFTGSAHAFTGTVHYKSGAHDLSPDASVRVLGSTTIPRVQPRSNIVDLPMAPAVLQSCPEVVRTHEPPSRMRDPTIFTENLVARAENGVKPFPAKFFQQAFDDLLMCDVRATMGRLDEVAPLTDMEILTGRAGVKGIEPLDLSTSMGLPFRKKKNLFMVRSPEPGPDGLCPVECDQAIWDDFHRIDGLMRQGKRVNLLFDAVAKDEQVKIGKKKVRIITGVNIFLSMAFRKYFLPLMTVETADTLEFEHAVWIRPATLDWTRLAHHLVQRGPDRLIVGDFGGFDTSQHYQTTRGGMRLYEERGQRAPLYSPEDLAAMEVIAEEICNAWANFDGTIYEFWNSILSGHNGTVMLNNKVNALDLRAAFYELLHDTIIGGGPVLKEVSVGSCSSASSRSGDEGDLPQSLLEASAALGGRTFADLVTLVTYGDDLAGAVSSEVEWYNAQTISICLARHGYRFTDANKQVPAQPFYTLEEVDFLKRQFRWDADRQVFAAPLAWSSITKCLLAGMPPKPSTGKGLDEHCADLIKSQLAEAFEHGPAVYDSLAGGLQEVVDTQGYSPFFEDGRVRTYAQQQEIWDERAYNGGGEPVCCYGMDAQTREHHPDCNLPDECLDLYGCSTDCDDRGLQILGHAAVSTGHARPALRTRAAALLRLVQNPPDYGWQRVMLIADPVPARSHDAIHYVGPTQGRVHRAIMFMDVPFTFMRRAAEHNVTHYRLDLDLCPPATLERIHYIFRRDANHRIDPVIIATYPNY